MSITRRAHATNPGRRPNRGPDHVAVYLPMSYQLGGYTAILPRTAIKPVDLPIEQAMRFALTAGVKTQSEEG